MGLAPSAYTNHVTIIDSVRPLVSASCLGSMLIDCNCTGLGDGMTPVGRTEANPNA